MKDITLNDLVEKYFKQQQEVYGNLLYTEKNNSTELTINNILNQENYSGKETEIKRIVIADVPTDLFTEEPEWKRTKNLDELYEKIHTCMKCPLGATRKNFVFGTGNPQADIMLIGEAPGADEDEQGKPFVGRAGQLLTKIIESIGLTRDDVFICNILKCRPPENRSPFPSEIEECEPYLIKQIELIQPKFILALGLTAIDTLLKKKNKMGEIRGTIQNYHGIKMVVTYHPAALLRNPGWKKMVWDDVRLLRKLYDEYLNSKLKI
ncbi:MAG: uracil-DNA glycosylase [Bacteroidetes bacterium]|nr:MAG: uracil-DNA glycosylase [Bacteroidota bacterium]